MSRRFGCRVYIGGLRSDTKLSDVEDFFRRFRRRFDVMLKERFGFIVSLFLPVDLFPSGAENHFLFFEGVR